MLLSVVRMRSGSTMQASVRPPDRIEKPSPSWMQKKALPKRPNTTDGTAARASRLICTMRPSRLRCGSNSDRNTATPTASGTAMARQTIKIRKVETRIGPMPPARPAFSGASVTNDQEICPNPLPKRSRSTHRKAAMISPAPIHRTMAQASQRKLRPRFAELVRMDIGHRLFVGHEFEKRGRQHHKGDHRQRADEEGRAVDVHRIGDLERDVRRQGAHRLEDALGHLYDVPGDHHHGHGFADRAAGPQDRGDRQSLAGGGDDDLNHG